MVRLEASLEQGANVDRSPGGAGTAIGKVLELLKPETFYVSVFKRELFMVVNTEDVALLSEAAHAIQLIAGCNPEVTPIMTGDEAMMILPQAVASATKTAEALGF
jgi:hypothetical protein